MFRLKRLPQLPTAMAAAALCICGLLSGCPPETPRVLEERQLQQQAREGEYLYAANKLFETDSKLDIRDRVTYPKLVEFMDPSTNMSNRDLTFERCKVCHRECGFEGAFDKEHYGTAEWKPRITGQGWAPVIERMRVKENSYLNEVVAERIYNYLRDETTGKYDEAADEKGALVIEVDPPPADGESGQGTQAGGAISPPSGP